jgi:predicted RNase H-like HicB family nuclease
MDKYKVVIWWSEDDDAFLAEMPELPGCMADGKTQEEALANVRQIGAEWIEMAQQLGREVPRPANEPKPHTVAA